MRSHGRASSRLSNSTVSRGCTERPFPSLSKASADVASVGRCRLARIGVPESGDGGGVPLGGSWPRSRAYASEARWRSAGPEQFAFAPPPWKASPSRQRARQLDEFKRNLLVCGVSECVSGAGAVGDAALCCVHNTPRFGAISVCHVLVHAAEKLRWRRR